MDVLTEVFPMLAGVLTGLVCVVWASLARGRTWKFVCVVLAVAFGVLATYLSGEYRESWAFVLLDMLWVSGIALAVVFGVNLYRRRSRHKSR